MSPEMEFKEFKPRFKSAKTRFKLSAGLNLETFENFKWNQPYLSRGLNLDLGLNSLNSTSVLLNNPECSTPFVHGGDILFMRLVNTNY